MMLRKRTLAVLAVIAGAVLMVWFLPFGRDRLSVADRVELNAHARLVAARKGAEPLPFTTDGCSGGMSTVWRGLAEALPDLATGIGTHPPWEGCCVTHDQAYHDAAGATTAKASFAARLRADRALRDCVAAWETGLPPSGQQALADAMYHAVRSGGGPCTGLPWRWGYGLPRCAGFGTTD